MEPQEKADNPSKSPPDRLALVAAVCAMTGVGLSGIALGLGVVNESIANAPDLVDRAMGISLGIAIPLGYVVAPLLAAMASWMAVGYSQQIERSQSDPGEAAPGRRTARRLLVTAVSLALPCGLAAVGAILRGCRLGIALPGGLAHLLFLAAFVAAAAGSASARLYRHSPGTFGRRLCGRSTILAVVLVGVAFTPIPDHLSYYSRCSVYALGGETFSGRSETLKGTTVVATLDCAVPARQNVVWCSSFQLAWNDLRDNVIGGPLKVVGAEALAERLNAGGPSIADLEPGSAYAAAGWIRQGIVDTIKEDMASQFASHAVPDFNDYPVGILAYSYLTAQVPFKYPYRQVERAFIFTDSRGVEAEVEAFGLWEAHLSQYEKVREQVDVLFSRSSDPNDRGFRPDEYAIDLCKHSAPYQVVVARVDLKGTLGETLDYMRLRASEFKKLEYYDGARQFRESDVLKVPEMFWEIEHRFRDLIGRGVVNANVNMPIVEAMQTIRFRLDRYGAMLESESLTAIAAMPRHFEFNRPFLVYMQKRGAEEPFFAMWVDNAELLTPR